MARRRSRSQKRNTRRYKTIPPPHRIPRRPRLRFSRPSRERPSRPTVTIPSRRKERVLPARSEVKRRLKKKPQRKHLTYTTLTHEEKKPKLHCVRRKMRKEIMHALKKSGRGGQKRAKWTDESRLKC
jgi:hypothetical protein